MGGRAPARPVCHSHPSGSSAPGLTRHYPVNKLYTHTVIRCLSCAPQLSHPPFQPAPNRSGRHARPAVPGRPAAAAAGVEGRCGYCRGAGPAHRACATGCRAARRRLARSGPERTAAGPPRQWRTAAAVADPGPPDPGAGTGGTGGAALHSLCAGLAAVRGRSALVGTGAGLREGGPVGGRAVPARRQLRRRAVLAPADQSPRLAPPAAGRRHRRVPGVCLPFLARGWQPVPRRPAPGAGCLAAAGPGAQESRCHAGSPPPGAGLAAMRWACILLTRLALDGVQRGRDDADAPLVLVSGHVPRRLIRAVNAQARALGLRPGMSLTAAQTLVTDFAVAEYDEQQISHWQHFLAAWAYRYSSHVSLDYPHALLLEVESSLGLFGPWPRFEQRLREDLAGLGFQHRIVLAPNPAAARALTNVHDGLAVMDSLALREHIQRLPIQRSGLDARSVATLSRMGLKQLGQLLRLPRDTLARRFPAEVLAHLDRLLGVLPVALGSYQPADEFAARIEFNFEVDSHQALLFP